MTASTGGRLFVIAAPSGASATEGSTITAVPAGDGVSAGENPPAGPRVAERTR